MYKSPNSGFAGNTPLAGFQAPLLFSCQYPRRISYSIPWKLEISVVPMRISSIWSGPCPIANSARQYIFPLVFLCMELQHMEVVHASCHR